MSFVIDASAAAALHYPEEASRFRRMEEHLIGEGTAFTAPNFYQEVMEALRRGIRNRRSAPDRAARWLELLDSFQITPVAVHPCAGSAAWIIAETLNISAYDAGYLAVAKTKGLPIFTMDDEIIAKAPRIGVRVNPAVF